MLVAAVVLTFSAGAFAAEGGRGAAGEGEGKEGGWVGRGKALVSKVRDSIDQAAIQYRTRRQAGQAALQGGSGQCVRNQERQGTCAGLGSGQGQNGHCERAQQCKRDGGCEGCPNAGSECPHKGKGNGQGQGQGCGGGRGCRR
jgi:hypothetical protein